MYINSNMKSVYSVGGYILFVMGFLSILLGLMGIKLTLLAWLDNFSAIVALVIKLGMLIGGLIFMYMSRLDHSEFES